MALCFNICNIEGMDKYRAVGKCSLSSLYYFIPRGTLLRLDSVPLQYTKAIVPSPRSGNSRIRSSGSPFCQRENAKELAEVHQQRCIVPYLCITIVHLFYLNAVLESVFSFGELESKNPTTRHSIFS